MAVRSDVESVAGFRGPKALAWRGPYAWHDGERLWSTTNRQLDLWIELLHTLELEPEAVLFPALCVDFEGDHWTHAQVSPTDLWTCYGIAVDEIPVWRTVLAHVVEQLDRGHAVLLDADEFHLPDMAGSSHHREHARTLIAVTGYDQRAHTLRYLHGATEGLVGGADLDALTTPDPAGAQLAPSMRVVKLDRMMARTPTERAQLGIALARYHGTRLPQRNPVRAFGDALRTHGAWLAGGTADQYQRWAFATLHQCGAAFEIAADVCAWLAQRGEPVSAAVPHLRLVSRAARTLHQRLVRLPQQGRMPDVSQTISDMAHSWDDAMAILRPRYGA
ncbi:MAG TPA: DUF1839 family protein [Gemmatimonadaceae bacterium]|nr:DUF1839 family protein [Gemmatimonadaceae bacterium]